MNNAFCGWMRGVAMALALAGLSSNANGTETEEIRFRGGHPWLSRDQMIELPDDDTVERESPTAEESDSPLHKKGGQRDVSPGNIHAVSAGRYFDITIAMQQHRSDAERAKIGASITNFAKGVYEMTEGHHFIGKVSIFENPGNLKADIHWSTATVDSGGKQIRASTEWSVRRSSKIKMNDFRLQDAEYSGGVLTHEWGHYEYGFLDEYRETDPEAQVVKDTKWNQPHSTDIDVTSSLMAGWRRGIPFKEQCNLSYAVDKSLDDTQNQQIKWRSTRQTAQYRVFEKSCLEQLVNPTDPLIPWQGKVYAWWLGWRYLLTGEIKLINLPSFKMPKWPEFSGINPKNPPKIDLDSQGETKALRYLNIVWEDAQKPMVAFCIDRSGSMSSVQLANAKANTKREIDKLQEEAMVEVLAFDSYDSISRIVPLTKVTTANKAGIKAKVDAITSGNNTALWDAAGMALTDMQTHDANGNYVKSLLLMTDGANNDSRKETYSSIVQKCQEMGVAFNSISYGQKADSNLASASAATGGKNFASSDSLASLSSAFSRAGTHGSDRGAVVDSEGVVGTTGTWTETFTLDSSVTNLMATVTLSVLSANARVVLESPSGRQFPADSTVDVGGESSWVFMQGKPAVGMWKVIVTAPQGTSAGCFVDASAAAEPPRLMVWMDESDMVVCAAVSHEAPVDGARVRAVINDNGTKREVPFTSIGGGTYVLALLDCGAFQNGFSVRADAEQGVATYTYVTVMGSGSYDEGAPIPESFTRSEWLDLSRFNEMPVRFVEVHPRWPWEAKVDVDFQVAPTDKNTKVSAKLTGIDNQTGYVYPLSSVTCDDTLSELSPGAHRLTWNAAADLPGMDIEDFAVRFDVTTGMALGVVTGLTASAGTYFDGVHVAWGTVANATGYRVYRSDTADGTGRVLLATQTGRTYTDSTAVIGKKYYYYWIQPIIVGSNGVVKHEGQLAVSGGAWRCQLGGVSGLSASGGSHYDGVHLSWTGPNGATSYRIYRGTTANVASKTLLTTTSSTYYIDTSAAKLQKYYYYWVEPVAVVSGTTYTGAMNSSPVSGWRNKLGTPTFHFANWRPGHKSRPDIDLYIDSPVSGATRYEYMSGDQSWRWKAMESVGEGSSGYDISSMLYGSSATIGWAWAYRYELRVYVRAANNEGVGDWVKWNLADHLKESAFKNSEFYKLYPKP